MNNKQYLNFINSNYSTKLDRTILVDVKIEGDITYPNGDPLRINKYNCTLFSRKKDANSYSTQLIISARDQSGTNLIGNSVSETIEQINLFNEFLREKHHIELNFSNARITKIELHRTLHTEDDYKLYFRPLAHLFNIDVPNNYRQINDTICCAVDGGYSVKANGAVVKCYNKSAEMLIKRNIKFPQNHLRVEVVLGKCGNLGTAYSVKKLLGTTNFFQLTDEITDNAFKEVINFFTSTIPDREQDFRDELLDFFNNLPVIKSNQDLAYRILVEASETELKPINKVRFLDYEDILKTFHKANTKVKPRKMTEIRNKIKTTSSEQFNHFCQGDHHRFDELAHKLTE